VSVDPVPGSEPSIASEPQAIVAAVAGKAFVDLHCHTSASFDSLASPASMVKAAAARGVTHLAITDHDRIDGALRARDAGARIAPELTILVGEEIRTRGGDLIAVFLEEAVPPGMSALDTIAAVREQGGLVGLPHPYDRLRGSLSKSAEVAAFESLAGTVDWIEAWNPRILFGPGNELAAELANRVGVPGVAVSDSHTTLEVGLATTAMTGDPSTADGLKLALAGELQLVTGRASRYVRVVTPIARLLNRFPDEQESERARTGSSARRPGRAGGRGGPGLARPAASPAPDDHLDGPADRAARAVRPGPSGFRAREAAGADRPGEPVAPARGVRRLLSRLPAPRLAVGVTRAPQRLPAQDPRRNRDHLPVLAGQLPRAGQAR
jgi:predicted metal-dependent phosphoesterase TrpH